MLRTPARLNGALGALMESPVPVSFTHSSAKVRRLGLFWFGSLLLYAVAGLLIPEKKYVWLSCVAVITVGVLYAIRTTTKDARCGICSVQLFEIIEAATAIRTKVNFCPHCGARIAIGDTEPPSASLPDASAE